MKKHFWLSCILLLAFMLLPEAAWAFPAGNLNYEINVGTETVTVTGMQNPLGEDGVLTIPATVENNGVTYTVTAIGDKAFAFYDGDTKVEKESRKAVSIKRVSLPDTLTSIGYKAFYGCMNLEGSVGQADNTLILPDNIKSIGFSAFQAFSVQGNYNQLSLMANGNENRDPYGNNRLVDGGYASSGVISNYITGLHLPANLQTMDHSVFSGCAKLKAVEIPSSIETLESAVFAACFELQNVTLNEGLKKIGRSTSTGSGPFAHCTALQSITLPASLELLGFNAFSSSGLTEITLPENLQTIYNGAFAGCSNLQTINWNSRLETVKSNAFENCTGLTEVTIPAGIADFDPTAFRNCTGQINVSEISLYTALKNFRENGPDQYDTSYTVNFVGSLQNLEFADGDFKYIIIDAENKFVQLCGINDSVTLDTALSVPEKVTYMNNEYTVTEIGSGVFAGQTGLRSVNLPASLVKIANRAFSGCTGLNALTLPDSVAFIGKQAFSECTGLKDITFSADLTEISEQAFYKCGIENLDLSNTKLEKIDVQAFRECKAMTAAKLPDNLQTINAYAFYCCTALEEVNLPEDLTNMGDNVFGGCSNLAKVDCPPGMQLVELPKYTFGGCEKLGQITLPSSIKKIGMQAFSNCQNLQDFTLPEGVEELAQYAFYKCPGLGGGTFTLPSTVNTIGLNAFEECGIERLIIKENSSLQNVANGAFAGVAMSVIICYDWDKYTYLKGIVGEGTQVWLMCDIDGVLTDPDFVLDQYYTGEPICPQVTLYVEKDGERIEFEQNLDYTVEYRNNTNVTTDLDNRAEIIFKPTGNGRLYGEQKLMLFSIIEPPVQTVIISFSPGEGSGEMLAQEIEAGSVYILPECGFSAPENMEFAGWDYAGIIYQPGEEIAIGEEVPEVVLTATWKAKADEPTPPVVKEYWTISFEPNGGTLTPPDNPVKVERGQKLILPSAVKAGYTLQHWQIG